MDRVSPHEKAPVSAGIVNLTPRLLGGDDGTVVMKKEIIKLAHGVVERVGNRSSNVERTAVAIFRAAEINESSIPMHGSYKLHNAFLTHFVFLNDEDSKIKTVL